MTISTALSTTLKRHYAAGLLEKVKRQGNSHTHNHAGLPLLTWTIMHRNNLIPERPFDLWQHAYLAGIYGCQAQQIVIDKASQMGASEHLISYAFHAATNAKRRCCT
jgi:hypothetical protein